MRATFIWNRCYTISPTFPRCRRLQSLFRRDPRGVHLARVEDGEMQKGLHHPQLNINENDLLKGTALFVKLALDTLQELKKEKSYLSEIQAE